MKFTRYLVLLSPFLYGCDTGPDLAKLCGENPKLCTEFIEDNWCKQERKDVIIAKADLLKLKKDKQKYNLLVAYEDYAACMNKVSKIEHIKLKHKPKIRVDNYLKAQRRIEEISEQTKGSMHPELLYYHWTRYLDEEALKKLLSLEGSAVVQTTESQFNLATYYTKRDLDKSLTLLFRALELVKPETEINEEIFETIITIYNDRSEYKQAYIWLKILTLYHPDDKHVRENSLTQYEKAKSLDGALLDKVAQATLEKIVSGEFKSPKH